MMSRLLILGLIVALSTGAFASQQSDEIVAVKTDGGVLLVWNRPGQHFTVQLRGDSIQPLPGSEHVFFNVDGVIIQIGAAGVSKLGLGPDGPDGVAILAAHRDWEVKSIVERLGAPVAIRSSEIDLGRFGRGLLWGYEMPQGFDTEAKQQLYLTMLTKRYVVYFNGVVTATATEDRVRGVLMSAASTLNASTTRIDVKRLQRELRMKH